MLILIGKHTLSSTIQCIHSKWNSFSNNQNKKKPTNLVLYWIDARCIYQCVKNLRQETCDLSLVDMAHVYGTLIC